MHVLLTSWIITFGQPCRNMESPSVLKPTTFTKTSKTRVLETSNKKEFPREGIFQKLEKDLRNISSNNWSTWADLKRLFALFAFAYARDRKGNGVLADEARIAQLQNSRVANGLILWGHIDPDNDTWAGNVIDLLATQTAANVQRERGGVPPFAVADDNLVNTLVHTARRKLVFFRKTQGKKRNWVGL